MSSARPAIILGVLIGALILVSTIAFTVREDQQAIVLRFGDPQGGAINLANPSENAPGAGLHFKLPVDQVIYFDRQNLEFDLPEPIEIIVANEERLLVDAFVRYRINDPLVYFQTLGATAQAPEFMRRNFDARLTNILSEAMRGQLGSRTIREVINSQRAATMAAIRTDVITDARELGVEIIDVRIRQADFPAENADDVHERMISNYRQQAELIRANGLAEAREIRAAADEEAIRIVSAAQETAEVFKGRADAIRNCIFAEAYEGLTANIGPADVNVTVDTTDMSEDEVLLLPLDDKLALLEAKLPLTCAVDVNAPRRVDEERREFFRFYRSLNAYDASLRDSETTMILSPTSDFFEYFNNLESTN